MNYQKEKYLNQVEARRLGAAFLFCGFMSPNGENIPEIIRLDMALDFLWNPILGAGFAATGSERHGAALYLHHRFYRDGMPLEQAKLLAYCICAEVADMDDAVGGPIEMEVITPDGSNPFTNLEKYEAARQKLIGDARAFLEAFK